MNIIDNFSRALTETDSQKAQYLKDQLRQIGTEGFTIDPHILLNFSNKDINTFLSTAESIIEVKQEINEQEIYRTNQIAKEIDKKIKEIENRLEVEEVKVSGKNIQSFINGEEVYVSMNEALSLEVDKALTAMQQLNPEQWQKASDAVKALPDLYKEAQREVLISKSPNKGEDEIIKEAYKLITQKEGERYLEQLRSGKDQTLLDIIKDLIRRIVEKISPELATKIASSQEVSSIVKDQIKRTIIDKENISYTILDNNTGKIEVPNKATIEDIRSEVNIKLGKATLHENTTKGSKELQYSSKLNIDKATLIKAINENPQAVSEARIDSEGKITGGTIQIRVEYTGESNICNIQLNTSNNKTRSTEYTALLDINSTIKAIENNDSIHLLPVKQYNNGVDMVPIAFKRGEDNRINYQDRVTLGVARTENPSRVNLSHIKISTQEILKAIHSKDQTRIQALLESPKMTKELYDSMKTIKSVKDDKELNRLFNLQEKRFSKEQDRRQGIKL